MFEILLLYMMVLLYFGWSPFPVIVEMKVYRDSPTKNVIILVVTITGKGDNPSYTVLNNS